MKKRHRYVVLRLTLCQRAELAKEHQRRIDPLVRFVLQPLDFDAERGKDDANLVEELVVGLHQLENRRLLVRLQIEHDRIDRGVPDLALCRNETPIKAQI